jgi:hypothetical protein
MKTFSNLKELNEAKYGQPLYGEKDHMKNLLIAACGNDRRVLDDIIDCLSEEQVKSCFAKLAKVYGTTNSVGQKQDINQ